MLNCCSQGPHKCAQMAEVVLAVVTLPCAFNAGAMAHRACARRQTLLARALRAAQQVWTYKRFPRYKVCRKQSLKRQPVERTQGSNQTQGPGFLTCMRIAGADGGARPLPEGPPPCCLRGPPCPPRKGCCGDPELPCPARRMSSGRRSSCDAVDDVRAMGAMTTGGGGGGGGCASTDSSTSSACSFNPSSSLHAGNHLHVAMPQRNA